MALATAIVALLAIRLCRIRCGVALAIALGAIRGLVAVVFLPIGGRGGSGRHGAIARSRLRGIGARLRRRPRFPRNCRRRCFR